MRTVCAWCKTELTPLPSGTPVPESELVSHGICSSCAEKILQQMGTPLQRYLDTLGAPVVLVDSDGVVRTANSLAQDLLGKELVDIENLRGGDVFECIHAFEPGGCGGTVHCNGCVIRRTVMDSFQTGLPHLREPALLTCRSADGSQEATLLISTERVGPVVLLRVDSLGASVNS